MFSVDVKVGRLLEVRMVAPVTVVEIDLLGERLGLFFRTFPRKLVGCGDFRRFDIISYQAANRALEVFKRDNPKLERSGILLIPGTIFSFQLEQLVARANNPARRCFRDPSEVKVYLGELLTAEEQARLSAYLSEGA